MLTPHITGITTAYVCGRKGAHAEENAGTEMDDAEAEGATESKAGFAGGADDDAPQEGDTAAPAAGEAGEAAGSKNVSEARPTHPKMGTKWHGSVSSWKLQTADITPKRIIKEHVAEC